MLWTADTGANGAGTVPLPADVIATLAHGEAYRARVSATSHAGLTAEVTAEFTIDASAPTTGHVTFGYAGAAGTTCVANATLGCSWGGAADDLSGLAALEWAVGTEAGADDLLPFEAAPVGRGGASRAAPAGLAADAVVYCALRATNGAGLSATAVSAGAPPAPTRVACRRSRARRESGDWGAGGWLGSYKGRGVWGTKVCGVCGARSSRRYKME